MSLLPSPLPPRGAAAATAHAHNTAAASAAVAAAGSSAAAAASPALSSSGAVMSLSTLSPSRLSPAELAYLSAGVSANLRADGRARLDYRAFSVETGVVPHANGSARLRLGEGTDVMAAVNLSMIVPEQTASSATGSVACTVEHSAACAVDLDDRAVATANAHLTAELQRIITESGAFPLRSLVIIPDKQVWLVNIDVLLMDNGGNLIDAIVMAVKAALLTTTVPPLEIVTGDGGASEIIVNDDPFAHEPLAYASRLPLALTLVKIGGAQEWIMDATSDEEQCASMRLTLSLDGAGRMLGLSKSGVGTINLPALESIMAHASQLGVQLNKMLVEEVKRGGGITAADAAPDTDDEATHTKTGTAAKQSVQVVQTSKKGSSAASAAGSNAGSHKKKNKNQMAD